MRRIRTLLWLLGCVWLGLSLGLVTIQAADSPETVEKMVRRRRMQQLMNPELERRRANAHWNPYADGRGRTAPGTEGTVVGDQSLLVNPVFRIASAPPPDPVGSLAVGNTLYDYQHDLTMHHQVGRCANGTIVHFSWMFWDKIPASIDDPDRFVSYSSYTIGTGFNQPYNGVTISLGTFARGGYCGGEPDGDNAWHASFHQKAEAGSPYSSWHLYFPTPG
ncbi:MAG: hypothetical protein AB1792_06330, partial [Candidatus Zixiibacteriota bacterium]